MNRHTNTQTDYCNLHVRTLRLQLLNNDNEYCCSVFVEVKVNMTETFSLLLQSMLCSINLEEFLSDFNWQNSYEPLFNKATPNKFPASHLLPTSPSWSRCGPIIWLLMTSQTVNSSLRLLCDHAFRANGGHVVECNNTTSAAPKRSCRGQLLS